jgi:hypothetical protein
MSETLKPSPEGRRRYPPDGHHKDFDPPVPCVCEPTCEWPCWGECGCEACKLLFASYCDEMGVVFER